MPSFLGAVNFSEADCSGEITGIDHSTSSILGMKFISGPLPPRSIPAFTTSSRVPGFVMTRLCGMSLTLVSVSVTVAPGFTLKVVISYFRPVRALMVIDCALTSSVVREETNAMMYLIKDIFFLFNSLVHPRASGGYGSQLKRNPLPL